METHLLRMSTRYTFEYSVCGAWGTPPPLTRHVIYDLLALVNFIITIFPCSMFPRNLNKVVGGCASLEHKQSNQT